MQTIQQPEVAQNKARRYPRVRIPMPFSCSLSLLRTRWWFGRPVSDVGVVYDLSLHGVCVSTDAAIKPGDKVSLALRLTKALLQRRWQWPPFVGRTISSMDLRSGCSRSRR